MIRTSTSVSYLCHTRAGFSNGLQNWDHKDCVLRPAYLFRSHRGRGGHRMKFPAKFGRSAGVQYLSKISSPDNYLLGFEDGGMFDP